jgi:hypothetical protein
MVFVAPALQFRLFSLLFEYIALLALQLRGGSAQQHTDPSNNSMPAVPPAPDSSRALPCITIA